MLDTTAGPQAIAADSAPGQAASQTHSRRPPLAGGSGHVRRSLNISSSRACAANSNATHQTRPNSQPICSAVPPVDACIQLPRPYRRRVSRTCHHWSPAGQSGAEPSPSGNSRAGRKDLRALRMALPARDVAGEEPGCLLGRARLSARSIFTTFQPHTTCRIKGREAIHIACIPTRRPRSKGGARSRCAQTARRRATRRCRACRQRSRPAWRPAVGLAQSLWLLHRRCRERPGRHCRGARGRRRIGE